MQGIVLYLWVVAVLELDSHPDHYKGPDQCTLRLSKDLSHISLFLAYIDNHASLRLHDLCLEVLTVHGNELLLFRAKTFPPTRTISVAYLT